MAYEKVKTPLTLKSTTFSNRIVFPPVQTSYATESGEATDRLITFYGNIAKSAVGLTIVGATAISPISRLGTNALCLYSDNQVAAAERLFAEIKKGGSVPAVQLNHGGRVMHPDLAGGDLIGPSAVASPVTGVMPRALTTKEVKEIIDQFVSAAINSKTAGASMVEFHGAHSFLLNAFLSPAANQRNDAYGGSTENRGRIVSEILSKTREQVGEDFILGLRMSVEEYLEDGLTTGESVELINGFIEDGLDIIHVSAGGIDSGFMKMIGEAAEGNLIKLAGDIKKKVDIPVIAVGGVIRLEQTEQALVAGLADMVAIGRGLIADPELVAKSLEGRIDAVNECTACMQCFGGGEKPGTTCSVNENL